MNTQIIYHHDMTIAITIWTASIRNISGHKTMMNRLRLACAVLAIVLLLVAPSVHADEPARTHVITIDDYFTLAFVSEVALSPDGKSVAYAEGRWQSSTNDRKADLWVADVGTGETTRLTFDRAGYSGLQWAPDRRHIYFVADRKREGASGPPYDGNTQVWRLPVGGGEPLTELLVYPDAKHSLERYQDRKAKMAWDIAWFDRYVLHKGGGK